MAQIQTSSAQSVAKISAFLGLNEDPDGATSLRVGEMAVMRNFRISRSGHLQKRPGTRLVMRLPADGEAFGGGDDDGEQAELFATHIPEEDGDYFEKLETAPIVPGDAIIDQITFERTVFHGLWTGAVRGHTVVLCNLGGYVLGLDLPGREYVNLGVAAKAKTTFFSFDDKVYMLDGTNYYVWDGGEGGFHVVEGYAPVVLTATTPGGAGTPLESVNRLTGKRRVQFSPDGTAKVFHLPQQNVIIYKVENLAAKNVLYPQDGVVTLDDNDGTITFSTAPSAGTNTIEVTYSVTSELRNDVCCMRFAELYNGAQDTRVFLYGDGSNRAIYSGVCYDTGKPSAEYFPDLCEVEVGEKNTPITALVRQYSRLMAFKSGSAWSIQYGDITLDDGSAAAAFYVSPVNRQLGNDALGQVKLLENDPLSMDGGCIYLWHYANGYVTNNATAAKRISDRVAHTLERFDLSKVKTVNVRRDQEFWFLYGHEALIYNYGNDTWYLYDALPFDELVEVEGEIYGLGNNGRVVHLSRAYTDDDDGHDEDVEDENGGVSARRPATRAIACYAETGYMDFGRAWQFKYSPMLFVAVKPEIGAGVWVTVRSSRKGLYPDKIASGNLSTFEDMNFTRFSFVTNRRPQVRRLKLKVKKSAYYQIIYKLDDKVSTATVLETDVRVRYAGYAK